MTRSDVAIEFDKARATLYTGLCVCLFHDGCKNSLFKDGCYFCPVCNATSVATVAVTKRQCLRCTCYSSDVFCSLCWQMCLDHVSKLTREQETVVLRHSTSDFLAKWSLCPGSKQEIYLQWIALKLIEQPVRPFYLLEADGQLCSATFEKLLKGVWKKTATVYGSFQLDRWMDMVHPRLQTIVGYTDRALQECFDAISRYDPDIIHIEGTIQRRVKEDDIVQPCNKPAKGQTLILQGLVSSYDSLVKAGEMIHLFLPQENDTYYHPQPRLVHPREPDFYKQWVLHQKI
jgi:hypothetical protein